MFGVNTKEDYPNAKLNPNIVGKYAKWIAKEAGFDVPDNTVIVIAECASVGVEEPFGSIRPSI